jgi:hypothetical protein
MSDAILHRFGASYFASGKVGGMAAELEWAPPMRNEQTNYR